MKNELPDPPLTAEQIAKISSLSTEQIDEIDEALLFETTSQWQKVAKIIGMTMLHLPSRVKGIPDLYYAQRIKELVNKGILESQGNLQFMRYSEVRKIKETYDKNK